MEGKGTGKSLVSNTSQGKIRLQKVMYNVKMINRLCYIDAEAD